VRFRRSWQPPLGDARDPNELLRLFAKPEFGGCKEPVDDVVIAADAVFDELTVAEWANDE